MSDHPFTNLFLLSVSPWFVLSHKWPFLINIQSCHTEQPSELTLSNSQYKIPSFQLSTPRKVPFNILNSSPMLLYFGWKHSSCGLCFPFCVAVNKRSVFYCYRAMGEGNMGYGKWIRIPPNMLMMKRSGNRWWFQPGLHPIWMLMMRKFASIDNFNSSLERVNEFWGENRKIPANMDCFLKLSFSYFAHMW